MYYVDAQGKRVAELWQSVLPLYHRQMPTSPPIRAAVRCASERFTRAMGYDPAADASRHARD
eukprot:scaffold264012_cov32-Tisochrysis_lutea.AAC.1